MRCDDFGEGVVEVGFWVVGGTEWAAGQNVGAELEVQKAGFEVDEFVPEAVVCDCGGPEGGQAREEDVDGDLETGLRDVEDVFGGEEGQQGEGEVR